MQKQPTSSDVFTDNREIQAKSLGKAKTFNIRIEVC